MVAEVRCALITTDFSQSPMRRCLLTSAVHKLEARRRPADLAAIWENLVQGRLVVSQCASSASEGFLWLRRNTQECRRPSARAVSIFEHALLGTSQKELAFDTGLSLPSTAGVLKQGAERMGLRCTFSKLPVAVPLLAHAVLRPGSVPVEVCADPTQFQCWIRVRRRDFTLARLLSRAEYDVACRLLEGWSYEQIAALRGSSVRTVANQLSSTFAKACVSGRFQLLRWTIERSSASADLSEQMTISNALRNSQKKERPVVLLA